MNITAAKQQVETREIICKWQEISNNKINYNVILLFAQF